MAKKKETGARDNGKELEEMKNTLLRLQAEFENYKKRVEKDNEAVRKFASMNLIKNILPVLDSFELALKNTKDKEKFVSGVEMVYAQFLQVLKSEGLEKIDALNKKLDPFMHEVLLKEECSDKEEDTVIEELQKGYTLKGEVIRHSKVKVCKKPNAENTK